jgi:putative ABC transport system permease protein
MDLGESIKMAVKTLTGNKLRSSLTMLGIIIGNASVITMVGVGQGAQRYASGQFESLGPNVLFIIPGGDNARQSSLDIPRTLTLDDAKAIAAQVPSVEAVAPQLQSQRLITYGNKRSDTAIMGTTPEYTIVRDFDMEKGRFFTDLDVQRRTRVAALGADTAKKIFGDTDPIGESIRILASR